MLAGDCFKRFVVGVHVNVPTVDILVKLLKSKHVHFAFDVGVATFRFGE